MKSAGHVARVGETGGALIVLMGKPMERDNLKDLGIDGRIILRRMLRELIWLCVRTSDEIFRIR